MRFLTEKMEYFFLHLDGELRNGVEPDEALRKTVRSYAYVFFTEEGAATHAQQKLQTDVCTHPDNRKPDIIAQATKEWKEWCDVWSK